MKSAHANPEAGRLVCVFGFRNAPAVAERHGLQRRELDCVVVNLPRFTPAEKARVTDSVSEPQEPLRRR